MAESSGLDVAVHHAMIVRELEGAGDIAEYPHGFMERGRALLHLLAEIQPFDEGHTVVWQGAGGPRAQDRNDVGLLQSGDKFDLTREALDVERHGELRHQDLDDDIPAQRLVARQENERHSSATQLTLDGVVRAERALELVL